MTLRLQRYPFFPPIFRFLEARDTEGFARNKAYIFSSNTCIRDRPGEEGKNRLQERTEQKTENELREEAFILLEIAPKEFQAILSRNCFYVLLSIKQFRRFKK